MKKKLSYIIFALMLISCWGFRFYYVNAGNVPVEKAYEMGETVPYENDLIWIDNMSGYEVIVTDAQIVTFEEFETKYGAVESTEEDFYPPDLVYDITITLENKNNTETGIEFMTYKLCGLDFWLDFSTKLFNTANPQALGSHALALEVGSQMEFHLTFNVRKERFTEKNWKALDNYPLKLLITEYPTQKVVSIIPRHKQ